MKLIDDKGRLFGKINVIDFLVVIFLFSLMPMFYLGYKIFIKKTVAQAIVVEKPEKQMLELALVFDLVNLSPDVTRLISVGDKELDADGQVIGEIVKLDAFGPQVYNIDLGDGHKISEEDRVLKHAFATLKIKAELVQNGIYYKNRQIKSNTAIDFVTDKYSIQAVHLPKVSPDTFKGSAELEGVVSSDSGDIIKIKNDISLLKNEMSLLKDDIGLPKNEISSLKNDISLLKGKIEALTVRLAHDDASTQKEKLSDKKKQKKQPE